MNLHPSSVSIPCIHANELASEDCMAGPSLLHLVFRWRRHTAQTTVRRIVPKLEAEIGVRCMWIIAIQFAAVVHHVQADGVDDHARLRMLHTQRLAIEGVLGHFFKQARLDELVERFGPITVLDAKALGSDSGSGAPQPRL